MPNALNPSHLGTNGARPRPVYMNSAGVYDASASRLWRRRESPRRARPGETTMKTYFRALAVAAVLMMPTLAVADDTTLVQAFIPFEFTVGTTTLPAGTYRISRQFGAQDLLVVDSKAHRVLLFASRVETPRAAATDTHLTFDRYGDSYFLSGAQLSSVAGYTLPAAASEREVAAPMTTVTST